MSDRRNMWFPWRMGIEAALTPGSVLSVDIPSIMEGRLARQVQGYTSSRSIFNIQANSSSLASESQMICGIINLPEGVILGGTEPENDSTADWQYWEEFWIPKGNNIELPLWHRDVRTERKSPGRDRQYIFIVKNTDTLNNLTVYVSGRTVILEA